MGGGAINAYTLIELLAIIIIIAIIATITVPIVVNIIGNTKRDVAGLSAVGFIDALEKEVAMSILMEDEKFENREYTFDEIDVDVNGVKPTAGIYQLSDGKVTNATLCMDGFTVIYQNKKATTGGKCTEESMKLTSTLKISSNSVFLTYPAEELVQITENTSDGELTCSSSDSNVATCEIDGNNVVIRSGTTEGQATITVTSHGGSKYKDANAAILVSTEAGLLSVTANGYTGVYDGKTHGISVSSSGATIKYGTEAGTYNLDASPTYTDAGTYTVYYEVTKPGYTTVTGSRTVTISKANGSVTAPTAKTLTYNGSAQALINAGSSSTGTIEYKLGNGSYSNIIPTATSDGTYTVYYRVVGDNNHNDVAENSISVTINKATINYTANGYSGVFDGSAHGISVSSSGATIKYGTVSGTYNLDASPTYTDVGTHTVYYQITRTGYTTVTGSKTVTISKANGSVTLSANSGTVTYPNSTTFTVTKNTSNGTLSCSSSDTSAATCTISENTVTVKAGTKAASSVTITVTSAATTNYNQASAAYVVTSKNGVLSVTANNYSGTYDGNAHGISVSSSGATIKYGTVSGTYNLTASPTYTNAGTYTVYYQVTKAGYTTVTGSKTVTISKANGSVTLSANSGTVTYPNSTTFTVTKNTSGGALSCSSSNTSAATCSVSGTTVTVTPGTTAASNVTITVTSAATSNYNQASATYTATSKNGVLSVTANNYSGTYDGNAHGISVSSSGATIKYGTEAGKYTLTASPTYTNAGTYTVYYQVTKAGYTTVTGSKTVTISKANGSVTLSANSGTVTYPNSTTFTVTKNTSGGALSCSSSNESAATCSVSGTTVTVTPGTTAASNVTITVTSAATSNYNQASATYTATSKNGVLSVTANNYSGVFDGKAHGISVSSSGATIKYGTEEGKYTLTASPTYTNVGTYTVYYQVTKSGYTTVTGSKTVTISKANGSVTLSANSGTVTYPNSTTFTVTKNTSGGTLSCSSSDTSAATCTVSENTVTVKAGTKAASSVTITVTSAATTNYNQASATYTATSKNGVLSVTANNYSGTYDGSAHGISVSSSGATIKYGTEEGKYTLSTNPTYTNAGTYTVYYQVTKAGYTTVTGSKTVTISKANGSVTLSANSGTVSNSTTFTVTKNTSGGTLSCSSSDTSAATCSVSGNTVTVTSKTQATNSVTITVTSAATSNYNKATATYTITLIGVRTIGGVGYYDTAWIGANPVYYNPVTGAKCNNYHEDNSKTGYNGVSPTGNQTKCLKWYAYSEQNGNVNLLLDHNTTATLYWNSITEKNVTGPSTAADQLLGKLKSDTNGWTGIINRTDSYSMKVNSIDYTINYSGYKARIITAQEVANIVGNTSWDETSTSSSFFYFDSHTTSNAPTCKSGDTTGCLYGWLYDRTTNNCTQYGCLNNSDVSNSNYWTVSSDASGIRGARAVYGNGFLASYSVFYDLFYGVRPVITVSKSNLSLN